MATVDALSTYNSDVAGANLVFTWRGGVQYGGGQVSCDVGINMNYNNTTLPCYSMFTIDTFVGDYFTIEGRLNVNALAVPDDGGGSSSATADFSHTGSVTFQSLTNNATFLADSGAAYSPIPLPSAIWLFGSGLLGLMGLARRKRGDEAL